MDTAMLTDLASRIEGLSRDEQIWLLKRMARSLHRSGVAAKGGWDQSLVTMAADMDIQREIRAIAGEFLDAETDGLEAR